MYGNVASQLTSFLCRSSACLIIAGAQHVVHNLGCLRITAALIPNTTKALPSLPNLPEIIQAYSEAYNSDSEAYNASDD